MIRKTVPVKSSEGLRYVKHGGLKNASVNDYIQEIPTLGAHHDTNEISYS
jgi:hypothetical protein